MRQTVIQKGSCSLLALTLALGLFPSALAQNRSAPPPLSDDKPFISDENFATVAQQTGELKDPLFRAYMRARLIGLTTTTDSAARRQAALSVATEALSDLIANQNESWRPQAIWLHQQVTSAVKNFDPAAAETLADKFKFKKDDNESDAPREFSDAVRMMSDPAKASTAGEKARAAILTGEVSAPSLMGQFLQMQQSNTPGVPPLLAATLTVEDQKPGFLPLHLMPFLAGVFLDKSVPAEIQAKFISTTVLRTRLSSEEMANPITRSQVSSALQAIAESAKSLVPALYPEVASRLNALAPNATVRRAEIQAAEDRIKTASDQLEQMLTEVDRTTDSNYRTSLLTRAARLALTQGKLRKAVDLGCTVYGDEVSNSGYLDTFLASVIAAAVKNEEPDDIIYAVSKTTKPLNKAKGLIALSKYYAGARNAEKTTAALHDAARAINQAESSTDKLRATISLAKGFLEYDRSSAFEAFREMVDTINKLPVPERKKERPYYVPFPTVDELTNSFRLLAAQDEPGAFAIAQDIKSTELQVAALSGVYSHPRNNAR